MTDGVFETKTSRGRRFRAYSVKVRSLTRCVKSECRTARDEAVHSPKLIVSTTADLLVKNKKGAWRAEGRGTLGRYHQPQTPEPERTVSSALYGTWARDLLRWPCNPRPPAPRLTGGVPLWVLLRSITSFLGPSQKKTKPTPIPSLAYLSASLLVLLKEKKKEKKKELCQ